MKLAAIEILQLVGLAFASGVFLYLAWSDGGVLRWIAGIAFAVAFVLTLGRMVTRK